MTAGRRRGAGDPAARRRPGPAARPGLSGTRPAAPARRCCAEKSGTHEVEGATWFLHAHNPPARIVIVGAVHIAQALVPLAAQLGYGITVADPRRAFATDERFPNVTVSTDWPDEALDALRPDSRTAIVTLTHDPKLDDPALDRALKSDAFYIGALGSRKHARQAAGPAARPGPRRGRARPHPRPGRAEHRRRDRAGDRPVRSWRRSWPCGAARRSRDLRPDGAGGGGGRRPRPHPPRARPRAEEGFGAGCGRDRRPARGRARPGDRGPAGARRRRGGCRRPPKIATALPATRRRGPALDDAAPPPAGSTCWPAAGLLRADRGKIDALNAVDEAGHGRHPARRHAGGPGRDGGHHQDHPVRPARHRPGRAEAACAGRCHERACPGRHAGSGWC